MLINRSRYTVRMSCIRGKLLSQFVSNSSRKKNPNTKAVVSQAVFSSAELLSRTTAVSTSGTAVRSYSTPPSVNICNGLGGGNSYACVVAQENLNKKKSFQ